MKKLFGNSNKKKKREPENDKIPAHHYIELFHSLDPFDDGLTELLDALFLRGHRSRLPAISRFEPPVGDSSLSLFLWLPDNLHWHTKLGIPGINTTQLVGNGCVATVNNDVCKNEGQAL